MRAGSLVTALALAVPLSAAGQVASRVTQTEDGVVRFSYDTKADVEICEQGIRIGARHMWWSSRARDDRPRGCRVGTAEVELSLRAGIVRDVEIVRSAADRAREAVDLGSFGGQEAAVYLLGLIREGASRRGAEDAILAAMIADASGVWRELLHAARDRAIAKDVRKQALFWLGQEAADAVTEGLSDVAFDSDEDQGVRDAAIFALSQRPSDEGVPILMELARDGQQPETRRRAMFWLAQSEDERVPAFFEEILLGRGR